MTPASIDKNRAKKNPWGLTAHQCMSLRLLCKYGGNKRIAYELGISAKTVEHHLYEARKAMGYFGSDIRVVLEWYKWSTDESLSCRRNTEVS